MRQQERLVCSASLALNFWFIFLSQSCFRKPLALSIPGYWCDQHFSKHNIEFTKYILSVGCWIFPCASTFAWETVPRRNAIDQICIIWRARVEKWSRRNVSKLCKYARQSVGAHRRYCDGRFNWLAKYRHLIEFAKGEYRAALQRSILDSLWSTNYIKSDFACQIHVTNLMITKEIFVNLTIHHFIVSMCDFEIALYL
jgi:hypothetical protein